MEPTNPPRDRLTLEEAGRRVEQLSAIAYTIDLDLQAGSKSFHGDVAITFDHAGGDTFLEWLGGRPRAFRGQRGGGGARLGRGAHLPARGAARQPQRDPRVLRATLRPHRRGLPPVLRPRGRVRVPLHPIRALLGAPPLPLLRPARPQGRLPRVGGRPGPLVGGERRGRGGPRAAARRAHPPRLRRDRSLQHLPDVGVRRRLRRRAGQPPWHPDGHLLPPIALPPPGRRAPVRHHQGGHRLLRGPLRPALPVRQVRPDLRARVQLGRHGERRRHRLHRHGGLPRPAHRGQADPAGGVPDPRAGPHVVRRPGDHALVERPVAQRVLRLLRGLPGARAHGRLPDDLARLLLPHEAVGLHRGPAPHHPPHRRRDPLHRRDLPELRRHHLREGGLGPQAAGGRHRDGRRSAPGCRSTSAATGSATPRWPTSSPPCRRAARWTWCSGRPAGCAPPR